MKLLSLNIINFGNLNGYTYDFNKNIASFCEKNGYGKSTLVSFIKSMFYGMETFKKNSASFLDREHYYPFTGGVFGGNLIFEYQGHTYRIERTFDQKSEVNDILTVYKDNELTEELGNVPGETIFGISKESFERLIIINSDKIEIQSTTDVSSKLNNYAANVSDDFDIDKVLKKAKDLKKVESDKSKEIKKQISELKTDISNLENIKSSLDGKYESLNEAEKNYQTASRIYKESMEKGIVVEQWKQYDSLNNECKLLKERIDSILNRYKNGLPTIDEINQIKESNQKIKIDNASLERGSISPKEESEYNSLSSKYESYLPTKEEVAVVEEKINKLNRLNEDKTEIVNKEKSTEEKALESHFHNKKIEEEEINNIQTKVDEYRGLVDELSNINPNIEKTTKENKKPVNKLYVISLILFIIMLGAGIGLIFVNLILGIILSAIGGLGSIALLILILTSQNKEPKTIVESIPNEEYENKKKDIDKKKQEILILLARYQYVDGDINDLFNQFKNDANRYNAILEENNKNINKVNELENEINELNEEISSFFNKLGFPSMSFDKALSTLKEELSRLDILKGIVNNASLNKEQVKNNIKAEQEKVDAFYKKYSLDKTIPIEDIEKDINDLNRLNNEYSDKVKARDEYKEKNGLTDRVEFDESVDTDTLKENETNSYNDYKLIKDELDKLEEQVADLDDLKSKLDRLIEDKQTADEMTTLYENVSNEIKKADASLTNKYVAPIKDRFVYYADLLEKVIGEKVHMDRDFKVMFDHEGILRKSDHLSSGILTICALCFRLALLDNMFEKDDIFIIMDDPFITLDEEHFVKAKSLVEQLTKDKQILYFTCHQSRKI